MNLKNKGKLKMKFKKNLELTSYEMSFHKIEKLAREEKKGVYKKTY